MPQFDRFPIYWYNTGPRAIFNQHIELSRTGEPDLLPEAEANGLKFLIQREDTIHNLWHTMMEIMSLTMSLDILRVAVDPNTRKPFFTDEDVRDSQVVFLDDFADGPYYDLWTLFASKPSMRFSETSNPDRALPRLWYLFLEVASLSGRATGLTFIAASPYF